MKGTDVNKKSQSKFYISFPSLHIIFIQTSWRKPFTFIGHGFVSCPFSSMWAIYLERNLELREYPLADNIYI